MNGIRFEPTRPAGRNRKVLAFLLGALIWAAAGVLAVVLLGHSYIVRRLLLAVVVSWVVFGIALAFGAASRRRLERRGAPVAGGTRGGTPGGRSGGTPGGRPEGTSGGTP
jgi:hypothetical protein